MSEKHIGPLLVSAPSTPQHSDSQPCIRPSFWIHEILKTGFGSMRYWKPESANVEARVNESQTEVASKQVQPRTCNKTDFLRHRHFQEKHNAKLIIFPHVWVLLCISIRIPSSTLLRKGCAIFLDLLGLNPLTPLGRQCYFRSAAAKRVCATRLMPHVLPTLSGHKRDKYVQASCMHALQIR